jgi:peptidoglycan/xylan/chitin deacetylase (PgdA/CDA1 family)
MMSILVLHAVTDGDWFESLISWLKRRSQLVPIESVAAYYAGSGDQSRSIHLTVDDAEKSFADVIFPVLRKHGVHCSLFVSPKVSTDGGNFWFQEIGGYETRELTRIAADVLKVPRELLGGLEPETILKALSLRQINEVINGYRKILGVQGSADRNLRVDALLEVAATGLVSIGAHTMNHPILANEDDASCEAEISDSVRTLASLLGRPVELFAYPNGIPGLDFGGREEKVLRDNGIKMAFTTESRHLSKADNPMRIPRIAISNKETSSRLRAKLLLGSNWTRVRKIAGVGEQVTRDRLCRALHGTSCLK